MTRCGLRIGVAPGECRKTANRGKNKCKHKRRRSLPLNLQHLRSPSVGRDALGHARTALFIQSLGETARNDDLFPSLFQRIERARVARSARLREATSAPGMHRRRFFCCTGRRLKMAPRQRDQEQLQNLFLHHYVKLHFARCRIACADIVIREQIGSTFMHGRQTRISRPHHILAETTWRREVGGGHYVGLSQPISRRRANWSGSNRWSQLCRHGGECDEIH
jgi:hypothetical protein